MMHVWLAHWCDLFLNVRMRPNWNDIDLSPQILGQGEIILDGERMKKQGSLQQRIGLSEKSAEFRNRGTFGFLHPDNFEKFVMFANNSELAKKV
jgi:hypothetical protein